MNEPVRFDAAPDDPFPHLFADYKTDPAVADRVARDGVARAVDAALVEAELGTRFASLGDPARSRAHWQAAVDSSPETEDLAELSYAIARAGDADAALLAATTAAAGYGDPAVVWINVSRALTGVGKPVEGLEAAKSAIDLAGANHIADAFTVAIEASQQLGRTDQADTLRTLRDSLIDGHLPR